MFENHKKDKHEYNINEKFGIYIHIPKAAGTSVFRALEPDVVRHPGARHCTALFAREDISNPSVWERLYKVSWVRNPWKRVFSLWDWEINRRRGHRWVYHDTDNDGIQQARFKKWLFDPSVGIHINDSPYHRNPLSALTYIADLDGKIIVDFIGSLENIREDMSRLNKKLNKRAGTPRYGRYSTRRFDSRVGHHNKRERQGTDYSTIDHKTFFDRESKEYIDDICKWEIERFNYKYD